MLATARPLKLYVMVLQNFLCAPEQRSGALLGLGGLLQSLQENELLLCDTLLRKGGSGE